MIKTSNARRILQVYGTSDKCTLLKRCSCSNITQQICYVYCMNACFNANYHLEYLNKEKTTFVFKIYCNYTFRDGPRHATLCHAMSNRRARARDRASARARVCVHA